MFESGFLFACCLSVVVLLVVFLFVCWGFFNTKIYHIILWLGYTAINHTNLGQIAVPARHDSQLHIFLDCPVHFYKDCPLGSSLDGTEYTYPGPLQGQG